MKLLGIEFENFACFERKFIKLRPGLNLLVGRNNSGKTAILRGLQVLAALPIEPLSRPNLKDDLPAYVRVRQSNPYFDFSLKFVPDLEEVSFFMHGSSPLDLAQLIADEHASLQWRFRVWPDWNVVTFEECHLRLGDEVFRALVPERDHQRNEHQIRKTLRLAELNPKYTDDVNNRDIASINIPSGEMRLYFRTSFKFAGPMSALKSVRLIAAHRVVAPAMKLQTSDALPPGAENLAAFLQTLQGTNRPAFDAIEKLVTDIFPEYEYVNPSSRDNEVSITLTDSRSHVRIPLTHCGTGVEQVLTLATFVLTASPGAILLLDEPHSYLHPIAERKLIDFLKSRSNAFVLISTHSAIMINSVEADRINDLSSGEDDDHNLSAKPTHASELLLDLGYRNADLLFNDRLIFVEGESDSEILPILLRKSGKVSTQDVDATGFPSMDGGGRARGRKLQTSVLYYEKLLAELGRASLPRIYLFDGDMNDEDKALLKKTKPGVEGGAIHVSFIPAKEIEDYLLSPEAICAALREELADRDQPGPAGPSEISAKLAEITAAPPAPKASVILEKIYEQFGLSYRKKESGPLNSSSPRPREPT